MRRLFVVATCLFAAACAGSPSSPTPASPPPVAAMGADFSGYWSGSFLYNVCAGLHCSGKVERTDPFSLRLRQTLNHVTGLFASEYSGNVEIAGDVQPDGSLRLSGAEDTGGTAGARGYATFAAPALRLDASTGLSGSMRFERVTVLGPLDSFTSLADGAIVSARRDSLDAYIADLAGTWKGLYLVRECMEPTGRPLCGIFRPGEVEYLELTISLGGVAAAGELVPISTHIPVTGTARGRTIDLTGMRETASHYVDRIQALSATVDDYGRLKGSFSYTRVADDVTSTARVDLAQVVKIR